MTQRKSKVSRAYWVKRAEKLDGEIRAEGARRAYAEEAARNLCVLCGDPATHECPSGIGPVCDRDHVELDD